MRRDAAQHLGVHGARRDRVDADANLLAPDGEGFGETDDRELGCRSSSLEHRNVPRTFTAITSSKTVKGSSVDFLDIDLYHRVTTSTLKWAKLEPRTYRNYFGRLEGSNSARIAEAAGLGADSRKPL